MPSHLLPRAARLLAAAATLACRDNPAAPSDDAARRYNPDWTRQSHGRAAPQYGTVFPQDRVNTIEITMTSAQWASVRANLKGILGFDFGETPGPGPGPAPGPGDGPGDGPDGPPSGDLSHPDPDYVDVAVSFEGRRWRNVGFRLKGNSSLVMSWGRGIYKLPFRLNFDEFEDEHPAIRDQRLYGFQELSFSPGVDDNSLIREKAASDILRMAGLPAARTAFYRVYIDFGEGKKYAGVYTAVEVIDDTMVETAFGDDRGNLYKPTSRLAHFDQAQFEKKNNRTAADFSDVQAFITALNGPLRASDAARWRRELEATFDVDHFLKWLAVNNTMVNWDSYGAIAHNYYLYYHPRRKLVWIPWDHDLSLKGNPGVIGEPPPGERERESLGPDPGPGPGDGTIIGAPGLSMTMNEVTEDWPLLRYVADDPVYFARYKAYVKSFAGSAFTEAHVDALLAKHHALIAPHVVGADGEQPGHTHLRDPADFAAGLAELRDHLRARRAVAAEFAP